MGRTERMDFIRRIEAARGSRLLVYMTGDRRGLEAKIASDVFPFVLNHLSRMGAQERVDLYLYSTGGITMAGYTLVNIIREFCDQFSVLIPFKALSTATLIALGAEEIVMTKMGQLSPIDPSVMSPLGPQAPVPGQPNTVTTLPVNVEDVIGYLDLARQELDLKDEDSMVRIFDRLADNVHPLTLGSVHRIRQQTGFLARTLLSRHLSDKKRIDKIVKTMTTGRFSHTYVIGRKEAREVLRLNVVDPSPSLEDDLIGLFGEYDRLFHLSTPYYPEAVLEEGEVATGSFERAIVESADLTHVFRTRKEVRRVSLEPPQVQVPTAAYQERIMSENWVEDTNI